jgi:ABC-type Zn2+ transport system substrate-binding protein/surface adhesin
MNDDIHWVKIGFWSIVAVLIIAAISVGGWALDVALSGPAGQGAAYKQKESAVNRIQKQEMFVQLNEDFTGYLSKITIAKSALKNTPADLKGIKQTELEGVQQMCVDTAQQYNAESGKYTSRDWKSTGLPYRLNPNDCTT